MGVPVSDQIRPFRLSSEVQVEERLRKVQQAQERSTCRSCRLTGHCAGDDKCLTRKGDTKGKGKGGSDGKTGGGSQNFHCSEVYMHRGRPTRMFAVAFATQECKTNAGPGTARTFSVQTRTQHVKF